MVGFKTPSRKNVPNTQLVAPSPPTCVHFWGVKLRSVWCTFPLSTIPLNFLHRVARSMADSESLLTLPEPEPGGPSGALLGIEKNRCGRWVFRGLKLGFLHKKDTFQGTITYPIPTRHFWRWWFSFSPSVGYVNSLEGISNVDTPDRHLTWIPPIHDAL